MRRIKRTKVSTANSSAARGSDENGGADKGESSRPTTPTAKIAMLAGSGTAGNCDGLILGLLAPVPAVGTPLIVMKPPPKIDPSRIVDRQFSKRADRIVGLKEGGGGPNVIEIGDV